MSDSPTEALMRALNTLSVDEVASLFAPDAVIVTPYGQEGNGIEEIRDLLSELNGELRETHHEVTAEWNPEPDVWIAEFTATYGLKNFSARGPYSRVAVLRIGPAGIERMHVYGSHEPRLDTDGGYREVRGPHGWMPTL